MPDTREQSLLDDSDHETAPYPTLDDGYDLRDLQLRARRIIRAFERRVGLRPALDDAAEPTRRELRSMESMTLERVHAAAAAKVYMSRVFLLTGEFPRYWNTTRVFADAALGTIESVRSQLLDVSRQEN